MSAEPCRTEFIRTLARCAPARPPAPGRLAEPGPSPPGPRGDSDQRPAGAVRCRLPRSRSRCEPDARIESAGDSEAGRLNKHSFRD